MVAAAPGPAARRRDRATAAHGAAFDPVGKEVRSGQTKLPKGFEHWLLEFDGVAFRGDQGIADPKGYGLLEFLYSRLAQRCGITMAECRLLQENGRSHFMTRRFDRDVEGVKRFVQTFAALQHFDYQESGAYSYEQLFLCMKQLRVPPEAREQMFRRVLFNLVGCNQDDHVKNFAFLMDRRGAWDLAPAHDLNHAEGSAFTRRHQLSIAGKTGDFTTADLKHLADQAGLPRGSERRILDEVVAAFSGWQQEARTSACRRGSCNTSSGRCGCAGSGGRSGEGKGDPGIPRIPCRPTPPVCGRSHAHRPDPSSRPWTTASSASPPSPPSPPAPRPP